MTTPITPEVIAGHGISPDEYERIQSILGREPNFTELGIFSVMWSEHCSYKSSRKHLRNFPTTGPQVVHGPGENAGVVDIGEGYVAAFKMESHNHPSYIEPYEGAATGVGGILRDVFTMGARPIALLNSLRFGSPDHEKTRYLINGVVSGIAGYGNCVGVPTVGGETFFHTCYDGNILVNVFCLGIAKKERIFTGVASGVGNPLIYVGSKTGRDGIHGATMASGEFDDETEEKRPTVQVGDPFTEKLLIEACLEAMKTDAIVGVQDMGAAGLTSSSCEMAGRAGTGVELEVDKVPRREEGMTPYEVLLSESQERMLFVARKGREEELKKIFIKYGLDVAEVGRVTDDGFLRIKDKGETVAEIPALQISEEAPLYDRPSQKPEYIDELKKLDPLSLAEPADYKEVLLKLLTSLNIASKAWIYEQYDHQVRTNTVILPGSDASVVRVKGTSKGLALSSDCNPRFCYLDPFRGGMAALAEAARNVACSGGTPLAATDNLNFGNPEKPEVMWQMKEAIRGISEACKALGVPVVSGNVSLYNETQGKGIYPTPTIGLVGLVDNINHVTTQAFKEEGHLILLLGECRGQIGGSEYLSVIHHMDRGQVPYIDLDHEGRLHSLLKEGIEAGIIRSAHDCSEGGLAVALAECSLTSAVGLGCSIKLNSDLRPDLLLFGEDQGRVVLSLKEEDREKIFTLCEKYKLASNFIGRTGGDQVKIGVNGKEIISSSVEELKKGWQEALPSYMEKS